MTFTFCLIIVFLIAAFVGILPLADKPTGPVARLDIVLFFAAVTGVFLVSSSIVLAVAKIDKKP